MDHLFIPSCNICLGAPIIDDAEYSSYGTGLTE